MVHALKYETEAIVHAPNESPIYQIFGDEKNRSVSYLSACHCRKSEIWRQISNVPIEFSKGSYVRIVWMFEKDSNVRMKSLHVWVSFFYINTRQKPPLEVDFGIRNIGL